MCFQRYTEILRYDTPIELLSREETHTVLQGGDANRNACSYCCRLLDDQEQVCRPLNCTHVFDEKCWKRTNSRCMACDVAFLEKRGSCPTGVMIVEGSSSFCLGFDETNSEGSILITYHVARGIQKEYHPEPDREHPSLTYTGLLPENELGREVLKRLKCAWQRGLIFTVEQDGDATVVVPDGSIAHHTDFATMDSAQGHLFLTTCQKQLDALGIPKHHNCSHHGSSLIDVAPVAVRRRSEPLRYDGPSPSGTMRIELTDQKCEGHEDAEGSIQVYYQLDSGQSPDANLFFDSTCRRALLPNNREGFGLLKRLKYAFQHGHCFLLKISTTTGKNGICWSSIPHKSSFTGDFGYPDPKYFTVCHEQLDLAGVPRTEDLTEQGDRLPQSMVGRHPVGDFPANEADTSLSGLAETLFYTPSDGSGRIQRLPVAYMRIETIDKKCHGHETTSGGSFMIAFVVMDSAAAAAASSDSYRCHQRQVKVVYLPDSAGRLLERLKHAFKRGKVVSRRLQADAKVSWSQIIPWKHFLSGGPRDISYPDPTYLQDCHQALDTVLGPAG